MKTRKDNIDSAVSFLIATGLNAEIVILLDKDDPDDLLSLVDGKQITRKNRITSVRASRDNVRISIQKVTDQDAWQATITGKYSR